jgi:hypothetical protein
MAVNVIFSLLALLLPGGSYLWLGILLVLLFTLRIWLSGRKNTWERSMVARRVIVVVRLLLSLSLSFVIEWRVQGIRYTVCVQGPPTPQVLALLDHLTSQKAETLYLPPALPPALLTVLHLLNLKATPVELPSLVAPPLVSSDQDDESLESPEKAKEKKRGSSVGQLLTAEAMDVRSKEQMLNFVRLWAGNEGKSSTEGEGRRVDAVIWAHGVGEVESPALLFDPDATADKGAGVYLNLKEEEKARFLFFNLFLPQVLQSTRTSSRSVRLISLLHPIYPAGLATFPLIKPSSTTSSSSSSSSSSILASSTAPNPSAQSFALHRSYHAIRTIIHFSHLQRILDALALKGEASDSAEVPEGGDIERERPIAEGEEEEGPSAGQKTAAASVDPSSSAAAPPPPKKKTRSNIVALTCAPNWHLTSILRPFLVNSMPNSMALALLFVPPSSPSTLIHLRMLLNMSVLSMQLDDPHPRPRPRRAFFAPNHPIRPLWAVRSPFDDRLGRRHPRL